jgi:hypothetical protein
LKRQYICGKDVEYHCTSVLQPASSWSAGGRLCHQYSELYEATMSLCITVLTNTAFEKQKHIYSELQCSNIVPVLNVNITFGTTKQDDAYEMVGNKAQNHLALYVIIAARPIRRIGSLQHPNDAINPY